jgi:ATP-dependent RNA helicase DDX19/DBP5
MSSEETPAVTAAPPAPAAPEASSTAPETSAAPEAPAAPEASTDAAPPAESSVAEAQVDGSGPPGNGSDFQEVDFNVEVKLADLQADPNNPLFSAKSFEQLNLYVGLFPCFSLAVY